MRTTPRVILILKQASSTTRRLESLAQKKATIVSSNPDFCRKKTWIFVEENEVENKCLENFKKRAAWDLRSLVFLSQFHQKINSQATIHSAAQSLCVLRMFSKKKNLRK